MCTYFDRQETTRRGEPPALDLWVKLILKQQYGAIAREPVPDDLLRLLNDLGPEH